MKSLKEKKDDQKSVKKNSMNLGGKSPKTKKADDVGPKEFEEDLSMDLRMKKQPLKTNAKSTGTKK